MNNFVRISVLLMIFVPLSYVVDAQALRIQVFDKQTGEPVSFANVCFESFDKEKIIHKVTDNNGSVTLETDKDMQVAVSALGYVTQIDTLTAGKETRLYLQPTLFEMDEVVVTAQYSPRRVDQSIYKIDVIGTTKIVEKGATNLTQLLSNELNVKLSNDAVLGSSMSIQGLTGEHVKILIDGVPVIGRMNGNIDLSQLNMYNVDHIELIEGPMSVIYGSNALAGAVNIITRENSRSRYSLWQNSYLESVGVYNFDLGTSVRHKNHSFSISGSRNFFSGYSGFDTLRTRQWKPKLQYNTNAYYIFKNENLLFKLDSKFFDETIQNKGPLLPPYREKAFDTYFYTRRWAHKASLHYSIPGNRNMDLISSYSTYRRKKNTWLKDLTTLEETLVPGSSDNDTTTFNAVLLRGTYTRELQDIRFSFQAGVDINLENGRGKRIQDLEQSIGDYAGFFSLNYQPVRQLELQPGIRMSYNTKYRSPVVPSLNLKWNTSSGILIRASYARGFRAPSLKELYLYFVDINHNLRGNPDLRAEFSHNINLSPEIYFGQNKNQYSVRAGFFYNSIYNRITLAVDSATLYSYVNIDRFKSIGGQLSLRYRMHPRLSFELGLYEVGRKSSLVSESGDRQSFRFSTDGITNASWKFLRRNMTVAFFYKYTGRLPQFYTDESGNITDRYIESYHSLDISVNKSFRNDLVILSIGGKNLFDNKNIEVSTNATGADSSPAGTYPVSWGRTLFLSLNVQLNRF